jgi:2-methylcitrate dehydratase PrpD
MLIERLAPAILSARATPESTGALKLCLLHFLTCAFEARDLPWSRQAKTLAARGAGIATIVGSHQRASVADAAFANAVAGHGLVREDMHTASVSHLGVVVLPAIMALAHRRRVTGEEFATACIVGYEVGARIGRALVTPAFVRHWRPTGFTGPLAAAAAGARLLGLPASAVGSALSLAANTACGLNQWPHEGGEEMFFHPGVAARNALLAVELAELGAYGSSGALSGEAGLFAAVGSETGSLADVALFPADTAEISSVYHKDLPVCNFAQTPSQAALRLKAASRLNAPDIDRVTIKACDAAIRYPGCAGRGPFERVLQAKMSIPFCVAVALVDGAVNESSFLTLKRPELERIVAATTLTADPILTRAFPARQGAEISVTLHDGRQHRARMDDLEVASPDKISSRFLTAAREAVGPAGAERLALGIADLEKLEDVETLVRLTEAAF